MAEFIEGADGQIFAKAPGNKWIPIEARDAAIIEEGGFEAFARSTGSTLAELPLGVGSLLGVEGAQERLDENARQGQIRGEVNPGGGLAGDIAGFAPDLAAGIATSGGSLLATAGRTALVEGVLGAIRTPQDPLMGAAIQGGLGALGVPAAAVVGRAVSPLARRFQSSATQVARQSRRIDEVGAINRPGPAGPAGPVGGGINAQVNTLERTAGPSPMLSLEQATARDMPLSGPEQAYLKAWDAGDEAGIAAAERGLANRDFLNKSKVFGTEIGDFTGGNKDMKQWFTQELAGELGLHDTTRLTKGTLAEVREDTGKVFKEAFDQGNYPVVNQIETPDGPSSVMAELRQVQDVAPIDGKAQGAPS